MRIMKLKSTRKSILNVFCGVISVDEEEDSPRRHDD
jgi:hypothetical protein